VDGIIFGGSSHTLVYFSGNDGEGVSGVHDGRTNLFLIFFLGIQVKQMKQGTFVHQAKYTKNLMKKFNMAELKPMSTPMSTTTLLDPNENGEAADQ
jgi:hypothetical protein